MLFYNAVIAIGHQKCLEIVKRSEYLSVIERLNSSFFEGRSENIESGGVCIAPRLSQSGFGSFLGAFCHVHYGLYFGVDWATSAGGRHGLGSGGNARGTGLVTTRRFKRFFDLLKDTSIRHNR